jgi:ATP-dependent helicase Lhr and Lhr-like helicase
VPFWNGDLPWRPYELGVRIGRFRREVTERIQALQASGRATRDGEQTSTERDLQPWKDLEAWLQREYALDENSAHNLVNYVTRQLDAVGVMSSDTTIIVESFQDVVGEPRVVVHSPFGGRVNGAWALALTDAFRERLGVDVGTETNDDGILFHFPRTNQGLPLDIIQQMTPADARERILHQLPASEVFGARFRMAAARALLLPKSRGGKRTPFWLQRLKARGLLAMVRQYKDFPIVVEAYRECLRDVFDLPHLELLLGSIQSGEIRVVPIQTLTPSPVAAGLVQNFVGQYLYEWDAPKAERQLQSLSLRRELIEDVLKGIELRDLLKPGAIAEVLGRLQHTAPGAQARTVEELAINLQELGDLSMEEVQARVIESADARVWIEQLASQGRIVEVPMLAGQGTVVRWVLSELANEYKEVGEANRSSYNILLRLLRTNGPLTREAILDRYAFDPAWLDETLLRLVTAREVVKGRFTPGGDRDEFIDRQNLEQIHRRTITLLRKEIQPVPLSVYASFIVHWQHAHPLERLNGRDGLRQVVGQLRGAPLPSQVWERDVLPARVADYDPRDLDALCQSGDVVWVGSGKDPRRGRLRFLFRGEGRLFLDERPRIANPDEEDDVDDGAISFGAEARLVYDYLKSEGASFYADIQAGVGLRPEALNDALAELVMAGLVTNDTLDALHAILALRADERASDAERARSSVSALEAELAARLGRSGRTPATPSRRVRPSPSEMREAKRRVTDRLRTGPEMPVVAKPTSHWTGRWSLVHRVAVLGPPLPMEERAERMARILLERYGIVTRECLAVEDGTVDWGNLYHVLQRLEMRGEVRRGLFVAGLPGVQFALPEAVEKLRVLSDRDGADDIMIVLSAADPANLFGSELPDGPLTANGEPLMFARVPSSHLVLRQGQPVLVAEDNGERITTAQGVEPDTVQRALKAYVDRPGAPRRTVITQWNAKPVLGTAAQAWLQPLGFSRTPSGMERWAD